jgi:hypothetical protein
MFSPTHNITAHGVGGTFKLLQNLPELNYGDWLLGLNSITFYDLAQPLDLAFELTCSLVYKKFNCFSGNVKNWESLAIIKLQTDKGKKTWNWYLNSHKYIFKVNNAPTEIIFKFDVISTNVPLPDFPADLAGVVHFSLYKR